MTDLNKYFLLNCKLQVKIRSSAKIHEIQKSFKTCLHYISHITTLIRFIGWVEVGISFQTHSMSSLKLWQNPT